jgi:uncharacterized protein
MSFDLERFEAEHSELLRLHPEATLCGFTALTLGGWLRIDMCTTHVAVAHREDGRLFNQFQVQYRPLSWFAMVGTLHDEFGEWSDFFELKCLPPAGALADLYKSNAHNAPRLNDLCFPSGSAVHVVRAFAAFDLDLPEEFSLEFSKVRYTTRPSQVLFEKKAAVISILAQHGMQRPFLFGSCARGEDVIGSDIDILILEDESPEVLSTAIAADTLEAALGVPVHVVHATDMGLAARASAMRDAVPLF